MRHRAVPARRGIAGGHGLFVKAIRVIENEERAQAASFQVGHEFIEGRPVVCALLSLDATPTKVHADELEAGGGDQIEIPLVTAAEMDVSPPLSRPLRREAASAESPERGSRGAHARAVASFSPNIYTCH